MDNAMVKGSVPSGYLKFIKKKWGISGQKDAMKYAGLKEIPRDGDWVPIEVNDRIHHWIAENKGEDQLIAARRYVATDLGIFTYLFASLMGLERLLNRASSNYKVLFSSGELIVEEGDGEYRIRIKGGKLSELTCMVWEGAIQGFLQLSHSPGKAHRIDSGAEKDCLIQIVF